jgi:hypothetical protein
MKFHLRSFSNNPYFVFATAWLLCIFLYSLRGAGILPKLTFGLCVFLFSFILLFIITGFFLNRIKFTIKPAKNVKINYKLIFFFNNVFFLPNILYSGLPILNGVRDENFGIPGMVVIAMSLNAFTCICCFYMYLTTGRKKLLWYCAYCMMFYVVIISRGFIVMTMISMLFLWMNLKNPVLTIVKFTIILSTMLGALYLFGVAGNPPSVEYSSEAIFQIGDASAAFTNNIIPGEFFWSYVYITSPLSNLQYNINISNPPFTVDNFYLAIVNETMFDFISKRVNAMRKGYARKTPVLLIEALTVSTALAGSYATAGWGGMLYMMLFIWIFPIIYLLIISKNPLGVIGFSVLCTIYLFSIFDNMFVLSGLSLQLFFPIILMLFQNSKVTNTTSLKLSSGN